MEFIKLNWKFTGHLAMADEHCMTRTAEAHGHTFGICEHTPTEDYKIEHPRARCYTHYRIDGTIYKSKTHFIKALTQIKED